MDPPPADQAEVNHEEEEEAEEAPDVLSDEELASMNITDTLPSQKQANTIWRWYNSVPGENPEWNSLYHNLTKAIKTIATQHKTTKAPLVKAYMNEVMKVSIWPFNMTDILNFLVATHVSNPEFLFPPMELPSLQINVPFPTFNKTPPDPATPPPPPPKATIPKCKTTQKQPPMGADPALYAKFLRNLEQVSHAPHTQTPTITPPPPTSNSPHQISLQNNLTWDTSTNAYTNPQGMSLRDNKFTYQPPQSKKHLWSPDLQLTTLQPPQHSLTSNQYKQYHLYQQLLQHIHLECQFQPTLTYPISYLPTSSVPQGIAGIPAAVLTLEILLKEFLVGDRYATAPHSSNPNQKQPALDLAHSLRQEAPQHWHTPITTLYEHTDAQIKVRGTAIRIHQQTHSPHQTYTPPKFTNPMDKDTQRALTILPLNTNHTQQHNHNTTHKPPQQQQYSTPPTHYPNSNYKGKKFDPNFRPSTQKQIT